MPLASSLPTNRKISDFPGSPFQSAPSCQAQARDTGCTIHFVPMRGAVALCPLYLESESEQERVVVCICVHAYANKHMPASVCIHVHMNVF